MNDVDFWLCPGHFPNARRRDRADVIGVVDEWIEYLAGLYGLDMSANPTSPETLRLWCQRLDVQWPGLENVHQFGEDYANRRPRPHGFLVLNGRILNKMRIDDQWSLRRTLEEHGIDSTIPLAQAKVLMLKEERRTLRWAEAMGWSRENDFFCRRSAHREWP